MRKKVIYVDFIFKHRRVNFLNYYILNLFSSILKMFLGMTNTKVHDIPDAEKRKMFK